MEQAVDKRIRILDPLEVSCSIGFEFFYWGVQRAEKKGIKIPSNCLALSLIPAPLTPLKSP